MEYNKNKMLINCIILVVFFTLLYYFLFNSNPFQLEKFNTMNSDLCSDYNDKGEYCPFKLHYLSNQDCRCPQDKKSNSGSNSSNGNNSQKQKCDCDCNSSSNDNGLNSNSNSPEFDLNSEYWKPEYNSRRIPFYPWWSDY